MIDLAEPVELAPTPAELSQRAKAHAYALGFDLVGVAALGPVATAQAFDSWLDAGRAGEMHYLAHGAEKRRDTRRPLPGTTHAIVVALDYGGREPSGPVARYARGDDYHDVMDAKLRALHALIEREAGRRILGKPYVDTGPLLERDLAQRAGLGWFGKNTNLLNPTLGSFFFLGALVVDVDLAVDAPFESDRCGTCTRCLDACPTQAIVAPRELDATRCISYLTIELKGEIPVELRAPMGVLEREAGRKILGKPYVDTGPLLERDLAQRAGLGWFGKNTNLLNPTLGSFFFLGALVVDVELAVDAPFESDRCGTCTRCLDACPTQAIVAPRELDATRCISYLTIELKGEISAELRAPMGELLYGCDICQEVCPWNVSFARPNRVPEFVPRAVLATNDARTIASDLLAMSQEEFSVAFKGSPMKRAKLRGLKRNAAVVLGNVGTARDTDELTRALVDPELLVRDHAAWAFAELRRRRGD